MTNDKLAATGYTGPTDAQRARAAELHGAYHNNEDVPPLSLPTTPSGPGCASRTTSGERCDRPHHHRLLVGRLRPVQLALHQTRHRTPRRTSPARARKDAPMTHACTKHEPGSLSCHRHDGCRCQPCVQATRRARKISRAGLTALTDATPPRAASFDRGRQLIPEQNRRKAGGRSMSILDYETSYEYDEGFTGDILAYNLRGHGLDIDDIERFLYERYLDDEIDLGGWEVRESWLRKIPARDGDGMMHVYSNRPGPGARAVTVLERPHGWSFWCINHPMEPAVSGRSASQVIDGEELVARRLAELAEDVDPRRDVAEGYVYMCRECSEDFSERLRRARIEATGGA